MANIVPKLNLNKTPSLVEGNSLVFAKNTRLDVDATLHRDYGVLPMSFIKSKVDNTYFDYDNIIRRIHRTIQSAITSDADIGYHYNIINTFLTEVEGEDDENDKYNKSCTIVGVVPASNEFYLFIRASYTTKVEDKEVITNNDFIICYDERTETFTPCNCKWTYNGGVISGTLINNLLSEKLLIVGETDTPHKVPLKCINLSKSTIDDDETLYTQTPNIPLTNLNYKSRFNAVIPNGVYQFFIRYKVRDNFYTDWFPASRELFAGNVNVTNTSFGTTRHVNIHRDSDTSFVLEVQHLFPAYNKNYESFQVGFILSHDDSIVARAWKHFSMTVGSINFEYDPRDAYEVEVIDLTKTTYQIYDVANITSFKNKLYIANYKETDFNTEDFQSLANEVKIELTTNNPDATFGGLEIEKDDATNLIVAIKHPGTSKFTKLAGTDSIFSSLVSTSILNNALKSEDIDILTSNTSECNINCYVNAETKARAINRRKSEHNSSYSKFVFKDDISRIVMTSGHNTITDSSFDSGVDDLHKVINMLVRKNRYINDNLDIVNFEGTIANTYTFEVHREYTCVQTVTVDSNIKPRPDDNGDLVLNPINPIETSRPVSRAINVNLGYKRIEEREVKGTYIQNITIRFDVNNNAQITISDEDKINYSTLVPYQRYKFFIHYINQHGEITNGYYCGGADAGILEAPYQAEVSKVIYPKFSNINLPADYVACFFSILHVGNKVGTLYDIAPYKEDGIVEANCLDVNVGLLKGIDNIVIKQGDFRPNIGAEPDTPGGGFEWGGIEPSPANPAPLNLVRATSEDESDDTIESVATNTGKFHYSSDTSIIRYFGADGIITFYNKKQDLQTNLFNVTKAAYIVNDYTISEAEDVQLTKCTPYLTGNSYESFANMNLLGYICKVGKLNRERTTRYYTDGASMYLKRQWTGPNDTKGTEDDYKEIKNQLYLTELKTYIGDSKLDEVDGDPKGYTKADVITKLAPNLELEWAYIYSNYNLNYVTLSEDPVEVIKSYYNTTSEAARDKTEPDGTVVLRLFKSLTMSAIYELPSMYHNYTRKLYSKFTKDTITVFDNTVRSSELEGDESSIDIFKFHPNDYYNIPTNRGIIVNLIAIGDYILVHTKDSMFRFSGANSLQSVDGDIQQTEASPFDTGVAEVFGSDFGFAGLQNKDNSIVTENGYIFFDKDSKVIYLYNGSEQVTKISDPIDKLFNHRDIYSVKFANDYYNNRFFVCITFYEYYYAVEDGLRVIKTRFIPCTLSFNFNEQARAFVSLHDFKFTKAFNTKTKCYFITDDNKDVCDIRKNEYGCYGKLALDSDILYPAKKLSTDDKLNSYYTIIDVIVNDAFETIKTLNAVNWCSSLLPQKFKRITDNLNTLKMAEDFVEDTNSTMPCSYMRIYSDTCITPLVEFPDRSNNVEPLSIANSHKYPRFNQGYWTFNYFRNIQHSNNVPPYQSDQNSLIEGKYFVVRFVFDKEFKLEAITLNYNNKI